MQTATSVTRACAHADAIAQKPLHRKRHSLVSQLDEQSPQGYKLTVANAVTAQII